MGNKLHEIKADYKYWVKWNDWDLSQMTALLLGYDPFLLNKNYIEQLEGGIIPTNLSQKEIESLVEEYDRANSLIMNSIEVGKLNFRTSPKKFYDWALVMNIPLVEEFHSEIRDKRPTPNNSEINIKRKKQLYKIILSMAIKYKFNPENLKNPSTAKFRNAIERAGLSIDDNTIREVITRSYEHFKDNLDHSIFE